MPSITVPNPGVKADSQVKLLLDGGGIDLVNVTWFTASMFFPSASRTSVVSMRRMQSLGDIHDYPRARFEVFGFPHMLSQQSRASCEMRDHCLLIELLNRIEFFVEWQKCLWKIPAKREIYCVLILERSCEHLWIIGKLSHCFKKTQGLSGREYNTRVDINAPIL